MTRRVTRHDLVIRPIDAARSPIRHRDSPIFVAMKARATRLLAGLLVLDAAVLSGMRRLHAPALTRLMRGLTHLGDAASWFAIGGFLAAAGAGDAALRLGIAAALASLLAQALKRTWRRARPSDGIEGFRALVENPDAFSFPSGHTAAAVAVAVALAGQGHYLGALAFPLAGGIGVSRAYLGAHYPLDVAVGALLGVASGIATRLVVGF